MITELKNEIDILISYKKSRTSEIDNDEIKRLVSHSINNAIHNLRDKLNTYESRERTKLDTIIINGKKVEIPLCMNYGNKGWFMKGDVLYKIDKHNIWDKDGSFHGYANAWLKDNDRYVKLTVRFLGADRHGDRVFVNAAYYKDIRDSYSYSSTDRINPRGKYKQYVNEIIFKAREIEGLENFMKDIK